MGTVRGAELTMKLSASYVLRGTKVSILEKVHETSTPEVLNICPGTEEAR